MWRGDLKNENARINNFVKDSKKISSLFKRLTKKKIKKIYLFPYTKSFLNTSINLNFLKDVCIYRNPKEKEYENFISKFKRLRFIAIRPFGGKLRLLKKHKLKYLLNYSINNKNITKIILTCSKIKQIQDIISYCNDKKNI